MCNIQRAILYSLPLFTSTLQHIPVLLPHAALVLFRRIDHSEPPSMSVSALPASITDNKTTRNNGPRSQGRPLRARSQESVVDSGLRAAASPPIALPSSNLIHFSKKRFYTFDLQSSRHFSTLRLRCPNHGAMLVKKFFRS